MGEARGREQVGHIQGDADAGSRRRARTTESSTKQATRNDQPQLSHTRASQLLDLLLQLLRIARAERGGGLDLLGIWSSVLNELLNYTIALN